MNEKTSVKPITIPLKYSIHPKSNGPLEMCLFVKDPQRDYKDLIRELGLDSTITKVIGISKLRQKYKEYEAKRRLCGSYGLFLADARVLPLLPKLLGKTFFAKKRLPVPIDLTKKNGIKAQVDRLLTASLLHPNKGTCWALKVGTAAGEMSVQEITENVQVGIENAIAKGIPKKWSNVMGIHIKTDSSIALPLYEKLPDHPLKEEMEDAKEI